jgi:hypothetical protein
MPTTPAISASDRHRRSGCANAPFKKQHPRNRVPRFHSIIRLAANNFFMLVGTHRRQRNFKGRVGQFALGVDAMKRIANISLAAMLAIAGVAVTADPGAAKHKHHGKFHDRSGISLGFFFGNPYPIYRPYRAYPVAPRYHYSSAWEAHVAYCYDRWRSYREWDNTYQPFNGPRRKCRSPYIG